MAFPSGTGISHTFLNNTADEVRLLVIGEATKPENRYKYLINPELEENDPLAWKDAPDRLLGPHDALPDKD